VSDISPEIPTPTVTIRNFCIGVPPPSNGGARTTVLGRSHAVRAPQNGFHVTRTISAPNTEGAKHRRRRSIPGAHGRELLRGLRGGCERSSGSTPAPPPPPRPPSLCATSDDEDGSDAASSLNRRLDPGLHYDGGAAAFESGSVRCATRCVRCESRGKGWHGATENGKTTTMLLRRTCGSRLGLQSWWRGWADHRSISKCRVGVRSGASARGGGGGATKAAKQKLAALHLQVHGDGKVANREIRVWHFVIENGY
jgi:hypothetical protein